MIKRAQSELKRQVQGTESAEGTD